MQRPTRRRFLSELGLVSGILQLPNAAAAEAQSRPRPPLSGMIHGLGQLGRLYPGRAATPDKSVNVITTIDLGNGSVRQTPVDFA
jgi:hypothetical protein